MLGRATSKLKSSCKPFAIYNEFGRYKSSSQVDTSNNDNLKSEVVGLYKNLIYLSREWHTDLKPQIKSAFMKNRDVTDPQEIRKLIDRGEYVCREIAATYSLKKYRAMKRRYYLEEEENK